MFIGIRLGISMGGGGLRAAQVVITTIDGQPAVEGMIIPDSTPTLAGYIVNPGGSVSGITLSFYDDALLDGTTTTAGDGTWTYTYTTPLSAGVSSIRVDADLPSAPSDAVGILLPEAETTAVINEIVARGYTPNAAYQSHLNTLITSLKTDGSFALFDSLILSVGPSPANECFVDLVVPTRTRTITATMTWVADGGYTGDGVNGRAGFNLLPDGTTSKYKLDDALMFVYSLTAGANGNYHYGETGGSGNARVRARGGTNDAVRVNSANALASVGSTAVPALVMGAVDPTDATNQKLYRNGTLNATGARGVTAMPTTTLLISRPSASGSTATNLAAGHGSHPTSSQATTIYTALRTFMLARGLSV